MSTVHKINVVKSRIYLKEHNKFGDMQCMTVPQIFLVYKYIICIFINFVFIRNIKYLFQISTINNKKILRLNKSIL